LDLAPFSTDLEEQVLQLVVGIQRGEFGIPISAAQQPDLREIPTFYQTGAGNFWVAIDAGHVVGTIALLDIGENRCALRKMFVAHAYRGRPHGTAARLLETLLAWARRHGVREILLGTTPFFHAAHRFYEKNGFVEIEKTRLPPSFPVMEVDTRFYRLVLSPEGAATAGVPPGSA
jgi:N-acetylglutamate synthase-like GNAT family acetyltransferase